MIDDKDCPFGAHTCPRIAELKEEIRRLTANQNRMMITLYFIAGIVSVTLGVEVMR